MSPEASGAGLYGRPLTRRRSAFSLTPLIDVVFILLLFFMLVTNYQRWQTVSIDAVSPAGASADPAEAPAVLMLRPADWALDGKPVTAQVLGEVVRQRLSKRPALQVQILAAPEVPIQELVEVLDLVRAAGVSQTRLGAWTP